MENVAPLLVFGCLALVSIIVQWRIDSARKRILYARARLTLDEWIARYYADLPIPRGVFALLDRAMSQIYSAPLSQFRPEDTLADDNKHTQFLAIDDTVPTLEVTLSKLLFVHLAIRWTPNRPIVTLDDLVNDIATCFAGKRLQ